MKHSLFFFTLALCLLSCQKETEFTESPNNQTNPLANYHPDINLVTGSIFGTVTNEANEPIEDAVVILGDQQYVTDQNGYFIIEEKELNANGTFLTVEKEGYFSGSRRFYPRNNSTNYVYVQLLDIKFAGWFDAEEGGRVIGVEGLEIVFPENAIQSANGELYTGEVAVAARFLDPTSTNISNIMPGDLIGVNTNSEEVGLVSYGMMTVELLGSQREKLNIASGKEATLIFPVPESLLEQAPESIPLWSFEEEQYGIWVEEGRAELQDGKYIGNVNHFSLWNCDFPYPIIKVRAQFLSSSGIPLSNSELLLQENILYSKKIGYTDNQGFFYGFIPMAASVSLSVTESTIRCEFSDFTFGPFSSSTDLGTIELEQLGEFREYIISGSVLDCDNVRLSKSIILIEYNGISKAILTDDDTFELPISSCSEIEDISITAFNPISSEQSERITKATSPLLNFEELSACGISGCIIPDLRFTGTYQLTLEGEATGYGAAYSSGIFVELVAGTEGIGHRYFESFILPDIGGFGPYRTSFSVDCKKARFDLMDSNLGCGGGDIRFGPSFDMTGEQITAPIEPDNDNNIILYLNQGYSDGGCLNLEPTNTKMTLTKR